MSQPKKKIAKRKAVAKLLKIKKSSIQGKGVFTLENIKKDEYILKTTPAEGWNYLIRLNHSCRPNTKLIKGRNAFSDTLVGICNTSANKTGPQEITIDYRKTRWKDFYDYNIQEEGGCLCPSCIRKLEN